MQKGREGAFCVILPLQNTTGHMYTIRRIDIDLHKERVVYAYSTCTVQVQVLLRSTIIVFTRTCTAVGHQLTFQRIPIIITMQCNHVRCSTAVTAAVNRYCTTTTTCIIHIVILAAVKTCTYCSTGTAFLSNI